MTQDYIARQVAGGGTGPEYAASIVLFLNKAQLKEGDQRAGIVVTAKPNKNRFAKPQNIKFHLHFSKGMNPFVGLEQYATWDICGVDRGTIDPKTGEKILKKTARTWICKHLDHAVANVDFFTDTVFTQDVLKQIDAHVKPIFNYNVEEIEDLNIDEILEDAIND